MSTDAYIVYQHTIWYNKDTNEVSVRKPNNVNGFKLYIHNERDYCFSFYQNYDFVGDLISYGANDMTNLDYNGCIEMDKDSFDRFYSERFDFYNSTDKDNANSILMMKNYFDKGYDFITFDCY